MTFHLGTRFPNFQAVVSGLQDDNFDFYEWMGNSWAILFSHPSDFTPVCTTELGTVASLVPEFEKRNCKVIALSCSSKEDHEKWESDIMFFKKLPGSLGYPIIADTDRKLAHQLGIIDPDEIDSKGLPVTCRCAFFINPEKKVKASILYPATTGRDMKEFIRVLDSLQLSTKYPLATPEGWSYGDKCMVLPNLSDSIAQNTFPKGFESFNVPSGKNYLRMTPTP